MPDHEPRLTLATIATSNPMGAEIYQERIAQYAPAALSMTTPGRWSIDRAIFRSLRSHLPGTNRLPMGYVIRASAPMRMRIGRFLYRRSTVTHRMNLELPPAAHGDVITLHDVVAWRFPDESSPVPAAKEEARRADAVICVSEFTAQEAVDLLGVQNPIVIHNGVDGRFFDATPLDQGTRSALRVPDRYVVHVGGAAQRKNLGALAEAWPHVRRERPDLHLVLAGPEHPRRTELFRGLPGVVLVGRVSDESMPSLIAGAQAAVVPSLYEGFGLPVLEAMAAGVPVVAANTSSLPEVAGKAAILVEPTARGLAEGLLDATSGDAGVLELVRAGRTRAAEFSWERAAVKHAQLWTSLG